MTSKKQGEGRGCPFSLSRNWAIKADVKANSKKLPLACFIAVGLALPYVSSAGSVPLSSGQKGGKSNSGFFRSEHRPSHSTPTAPKRQKFVVVRERVEEPVSVSVDQTIVVLPAEPKKISTNKIYIPPRWVETESGVLVLEPGRWVEIKPGAEY